MKRKSLVILCVLFGVELLITAGNHWLYSYDRVRSLIYLGKNVFTDKGEMAVVLDSERYHKFQTRNLLTFPVGLVSYFRIRSLESGSNRLYEEYLESASAGGTDSDTFEAMLWLYKFEAKFAGYHNLHKNDAEQAEALKP